MSWFRTASPFRRLLLLGPLAAVYLAATVTALHCGLIHTLGDDCPMSGGQMAGHMAGHGGPEADHQDKRVHALCLCLDKMAVHGPAVLAEAGGAPAPQAMAAALPVWVPLDPAHGPAAPRGPPAPLA